MNIFQSEMFLFIKRQMIKIEESKILPMDQEDSNLVANSFLNRLVQVNVHQDEKNVQLTKNNVLKISLLKLIT